ncbi:hypothetical protein [Ottowia thiooxydans]|uniref:hypothetical protein n=1 Tax=Ottowia thiooxydans TaxID=219182 RepID=UPI00040ED028|nr:hypothetical protein [Ottowia thiooxydans]
MQINDLTQVLQDRLTSELALYAGLVPVGLIVLQHLQLSLKARLSRYWADFGQLALSSSQHIPNMLHRVELRRIRE